MLKLTKSKSTEWLGNGMGTASAEWVVKGHEHVEIRQLGYEWWAIAHGRYRIAAADTKRDLLAILSTKKLPFLKLETA